MLTHPDELLYARNHMWIRVEDHTATLGVTEDLQEFVPDIESIDMPLVGDELEMDAECVTFHIRNDLYPLGSPLTGHVLEINKHAASHPEDIFLSPYQDSWLLRMEIEEPDELHFHMTADEYADYLDAEH